MTNARVNLAPEVYQASQRAKQVRQIAIAIGSLIGIICIGLVVTSLVILGGQKVFINSLNGSIKDKQAKVKTFSDLPKAATATAHADTLADLIKQRIYLSRFFDTLQTATPQGVALSSVSLNSANVVSLNVSAKSYALATKYAKALEASNLTVGPGASPLQQPNFSNVQLSGVTDSGGGSIDFKLTATISSEVQSGR